MTAAVAVIVQARLGSSRLPGKALTPLAGQALLARCLRRLGAADVGPVILATTLEPEDDALVDLARAEGCEVHRGSTDDVLTRYVETAVAFGFGRVVRATGDNPAVDTAAPRRLLEAMGNDGTEYVCEDGLPYGAGVELVTLAALTRAALLASERDDREHVTTFIKRRPDLFQVRRTVAPAPLRRPDVRLTVDTADDARFMDRVFTLLPPGDAPLADIIRAADRAQRSDAA